MFTLLFSSFANLKFSFASIKFLEHSKKYIFEYIVEANLHFAVLPQFVTLCKLIGLTLALLSLYSVPIFHFSTLSRTQTGCSVRSARLRSRLKQRCIDKRRRKRLPNQLEFQKT